MVGAVQVPDEVVDGTKRKGEVGFCWDMIDDMMVNGTGSILCWLQCTSANTNTLKVCNLCILCS